MICKPDSAHRDRHRWFYLICALMLAIPLALSNPPAQAAPPGSGGEQVTITVVDAVSGTDPVANVQVEGWQYTVKKNGSVQLKRVDRGITDAAGMVVLSVDFAQGEIHFSTEPYGGEVRSEPYEANPSSNVTRDRL